ncbi:FG-GAP repeat domain-containing protein [Cognatishimia activa]|uniref:FG-GAP repeat domain-containing protein n=1 Tax=Cognatishimia activa TaxID=1715691 RepID=UPI00222E6889|nr:VCBS repeat-containing protein [Cognatishimia activa]UZD89870.1 VCBS repeat-containing protein [Cognatishimia activa]
MLGAGPGKARRQPFQVLKCCLRRALLAIAVVAPVAATADIKSAKFADPTTRYAHAVLGDNVEWGALELRLKGGKSLRFVLPESRVFEDLQPRLADVDLDGDFEVIVVESSQAQGGRLAVYDETGLIATTPFIGRKFRWLAPVGAADLDGDGRVEIAYVDRPHLAKTLRIWRFEDNGLTEVGRLAGVTNHRIGEDFISGGIRDCGNGSEMIVADAKWQNVVVATFDGKEVRSKTIGAFNGPKSFAAALDCS